ncbi:MAG: hypothetical protein AAGA81_03695 [Acidobacteriota bacterium]
MKHFRALRTQLTPLALFGLVAATPAAAEETKSVTFTEDVAPIFFNNCVSCHRPNDAAPMSLLSYGEARPWAKSIRRAVTEREMPPWDADADHGVFSNDISLSDAEIATIQAWVDQGAPQGDPNKMPEPPQMAEAGSWKMGEEPDYVIELAPVEVPEGGPDLFITQVYAMEVPEGKWVRAVELLPGNTEVLHHVVTYFGPFGMSDDDDDSNAGVNKLVYLNEAAKRKTRMGEAPRFGGVWVAGSPPSKFPEGSGKTVEPKQMLSFNMHYHPSGNAGTDVSRVGLYFGEGELEKEITTAFAADPGMFIPAGAADHHEQAVYVFSQDSKVLSFLPHMHQRGKSMVYTIQRPDSDEKEILLSVPEYDYDWQNIYELAEPIAAPAGSVLTVDAWWDNSAENAANPDASIDVPWGDGTNNEMLVAFFDFVVDEGVKVKPVRTRDTVDTLLALHDPKEGYAISIDGMGFGQVWGLVLPEEENAEGNFYVTFSTLILDASIPKIERVGDDFVFTAEMITSAGGTRTPMGFIAKRNDDGVEGEIFFGQRISSSNVDTMRGKGRKFSGPSLANAMTEQASAGAGGR